VTEYTTIMADPPWKYDGGLTFAASNTLRGRKSMGIAAHDRYPTMATPDICKLPIGELAARDAHLYLWTTNAFMREAHDVATAWGFEQKTIITWGKTQVENPMLPSMKMGYYYRSATEHVLFCVRGSLSLVGPAAPTLFLHPRLPHSVKPARFYEMVEQQSPGPYLEVFARRRRPGWDVWGNEVDPSVDLAEVERLESSVLGSAGNAQTELFGGM
jgi:N6-adenosine-specific RNA methylase IME4